MGSSGFESKCSHHIEGGCTLPFRFRPNLTGSPTVISNYHNPAKQSFLLEALYQLVNKNTVQPVENQNSLGFLQLAIVGSQAQQPVETCPGPEHLEHLFKLRVVQDGDPRGNKNLPTGRGVGHIHRLQRRILPYTNSQSVQEVHASSPPGSVLPVQSPTLWSIHSSHGVHSGGQEVKLMALQRGIRIHQYLDDWLVRASTHDTCLQHTQTLVTHCQELGWLVKSQNWLPTGCQLYRLPVQPERGKGQTHTRALAGLDRQDPVNTVRSGTPGPAVHVPPRSTHSNRRASPPRATSHEAHTVALGKQLEGPRVTRKGDPGPQIAPFPSKVVAGGKQCAARSTITPSKHALQIFTDASKEGWGSHLDEHTARGTWSLPEASCT